MAEAQRAVVPGEAGAPQPMWVLGLVVTNRVRGVDTGGSLSLSDITCQPGGGPPPHVHSREDELIAVVDGEFRWFVGDTVGRAGPGDALWFPNGVPHAFRCEGDRPGRVIVYASPGDFAGFFEDVSEPCRNLESPPPPNEQQIRRGVEIMAKWGMTVLPPPAGWDADFASLPRPARAHEFWQGQGAWVFNDLITGWLTGAETGGKVTVGTSRCLPGAGPPPHVHHREDELFLVLEGRIKYYRGETIIHAGPGDAIWAPRDEPHCFVNEGDGPARHLILIQPAGIEDFFQSLAKPVEDPDRPPPPPTEAELPAILSAFAAQGIEMVQPPAGW